MAFAAFRRIIEGSARPTLRNIVEVDGPASYTTGGEAFDVRQFVRTGEILDVHVLPQDGYVFVYDRATEKILAFVAGTAGAPLDEEGSGTNMSAITGIRVHILFAPTK